MREPLVGKDQQPLLANGWVAFAKEDLDLNMQIQKVLDLARGLNGSVLVGKFAEEVRYGLTSWRWKPVSKHLD